MKKARIQFTIDKPDPDTEEVRHVHFISKLICLYEGDRVQDFGTLGQESEDEQGCFPIVSW